MDRTGRVSILICALAAASVLWAPLAAADKTSSSSGGPRPPKEPSSLSVEVLNPGGSGRETDIPATIVTARGDKKTGALAVKSGSIEVETVEEGGRRKMTVAIADIETIEFTRWRGVERRKNEFAFYPSETRILLRDKKALVCRGSIPLLNRLAFKYGGESRFIFSYFYDYWKHDAWKNSGQTGREYPETNPSGDTLVKIIFLREEMKNPLEKLLSR